MVNHPTGGADSATPDDILQQAVASLQGEDVPTGPPPELIAATLQALDRIEQGPRSRIVGIRRNTLMKLFGTAAGLLLVATTASLLILVVKTPASAFAQAVQQVRESPSLSYLEVLTVKGQDEAITTQVYVAADGRKRTEVRGPGGVTTISDAAGKTCLTLFADTKVALVPGAGAGAPAGTGRDDLAWLQALKRLGDKPDRELGQKELDGKRATGFVATQGPFIFSMWVDQATGQPVRIEYDSPVNGADYHVAMSDFRFGARLDDVLFSGEVPAGYQVKATPAVPAVPGGEESVIAALRGYTRRASGKFPPGLADWGPWVVLFAQDSRDGSIDPETTRVMAHLGAITPFLVSMPRADYAYLGAGKSVADREAIVFWYKRPDGTYRAVYGDFSARDLTADRVPGK